TASEVAQIEERLLKMTNDVAGIFMSSIQNCSIRPAQDQERVTSASVFFRHQRQRVRFSVDNDPGVSARQLCNRHDTFRCEPVCIQVDQLLFTLVIDVELSRLWIVSKRLSCTCID